METQGLFILGQMSKPGRVALHFPWIAVIPIIANELFYDNFSNVIEWN
jgi:hypothetical protein